MAAKQNQYVETLCVRCMCVFAGVVLCLQSVCVYLLGGSLVFGMCVFCWGSLVLASSLRVYIRVCVYVVWYNFFTSQLCVAHKHGLGALAVNLYLLSGSSMHR